MIFEEEIINYENEESDDIYFLNIGDIPIILTAVHTMKQNRMDGVKKSEPFTKAIARYVSDKTNCSCFIKHKDNGIDSNSCYSDEFKERLVGIIKEKNIKLLIDIHGAKTERDFDIEIGTLNNLSSDYSTLKELEDAFIHNGLNNIKINEPFKGGGITQYVYSNTNIDVLQIEVNGKYRDYYNIINTKKVCDSLIYFINQYYEK